MPTPSMKSKFGFRRSAVKDIDRYVGARMRERRIMLGLSLQQVADLIGVTYRQGHKYEHGINRISAGRLLRLAHAMGVDVGYFFADMNGTAPLNPISQQRLLLELTRNFISITNRKHQEAICEMARAMAHSAPATDLDSDVPLKP